MVNYKGIVRLLFLLISLVFFVTSDDSCPYSADNTMCVYQPLACTGGTLIDHGVTDDDKKEIVNLHNYYRNKVATGQQDGQPQASNMLELLWSDEVAEIAERWAEQCTYGHDTDRDLQSGEYVGQNVAISDENYIAPKNFSSAIEEWYNEVVSPGFNPDNISPFVENSGNGHYTQVVWATTGYVGCGYSFYSTFGMFGGTVYNNFYVCNYAPGGNVESGTMYIVGNATSACPNGVSQNYTGLCGKF